MKPTQEQLQEAANKWSEVKRNLIIYMINTPYQEWKFNQFEAVLLLHTIMPPAATAVAKSLNDSNDTGVTNYG